MDVEDVIDRVWPGRHPPFEPLGGGITNQNFKVMADGEAFVLRIGGKDTELLGIDRGNEQAGARMAAIIAAPSMPAPSCSRAWCLPAPASTPSTPRPRAGSYG